MDNLSEPELGRIISLSLCNGFECSFVFYGYFVSGRCVERVIEPFPFLFPGEGYLLVADGYGAAALFQVRIIEYDIQAFVDRIDFGQTQQVAVEYMRDVRCKTVVAAGRGRQVFPQRTGLVSHVEVLVDRFVEQLLYQAVTGEYLHP